MGYDETTNLRLKKPILGTSKTEWPGYINGNFDSIDAEITNRHGKGEDVIPDQDNTRSIGSILKRFMNGFFGQITLGGVTRSTWPSPGSGSQSLGDVYNNGSVVTVDSTDEVHQLAQGRKFKLVNADGTTTYMEAEGGKGITLPGNDVRENLLSNSLFSIWSNATLENVGGNLMANGSFTVDASGWTATNGTIASVAGGQSGNCLQITMVSGTLQYADSAALTTVAGKLYRLTVYVQSGTGGTAYIVQAYNSGRTVLLNAVTGNTTGSWTPVSFVFRATDASSYVRFIKYNSTAGTMLFDEVSVNEVTPGCVSADPLAIDDWSKASGTLIYRQHGDSAYTKEGSLYSLKVVGGASACQVSWPNTSVSQEPFFIARFRGRTVTFSCWVWSSAASKARLSIYDTQHTYSTYHSGGGAWEWLEVTRTIPAGATQFYVTLFSGTSTTAYFSQPQLVYGAATGASNYSPRPGEIIWTETPIALSSLDNKSNLSTQAATTLIAEVDSLGFIGKGAKAVYLSITANDTGSAGADAQVSLGPTATNQPFSCSPGGLPNSRAARAQGWAPLAPDGSIVYTLTATGSGTLSIQKLKVIGVQF